MTRVVEVVDRRPRPIETLERWDRARVVRAWVRAVTRRYDESALRVAVLRERVPR